jgi:hypothetical protein
MLLACGVILTLPWHSGMCYAARWDVVVVASTGCGGDRTWRETMMVVWA